MAHLEALQRIPAAFPMVRVPPAFSAVFGISASTDYYHGLLVSVLAATSDRPVQNATGLEGVFDINLKWAPEGTDTQTAAAEPSLFSALRSELGLRLEPRTSPYDVLVIEHVERMPTEN